jgi:hypothetical protein
MKLQGEDLDTWDRQMGEGWLTRLGSTDSCNACAVGIPAGVNINSVQDIEDNMSHTLPISWASPLFRILPSL